MCDPSEESLRDLLKASAPQPDGDAHLGRVLKTVNRQVSVGDLFSLIGHWLQALTIGINNGSPHLAPVSRISAKNASSVDKAE